MKGGEKEGVRERAREREERHMDAGARNRRPALQRIAEIYGKETTRGARLLEHALQHLLHRSRRPAAPRTGGASSSWPASAAGRSRVEGVVSALVLAGASLGAKMGVVSQVLKNGGKMNRMSNAGQQVTAILI
jgi:hypothetical protein